MSETNSSQRLRLWFAKGEAIKYIGHLDLMLAWERALRRARLPLAYSQGFNPRPKMQAASSLPLGATGSAELLDIILTEPLSVEETQRRIQAKLPAGLTLSHVEEVPLKEPTLQQRVRQAEYRVTVETDLAAVEIEQRIQTVMAADEIWQTRRRRKREERINIRPWIHHLSLTTKLQADAIFEMELTAGQHGNLRPEQVLDALGLADTWFSIERTWLIIDEADDNSDLPSQS